MYLFGISIPPGPGSCFRYPALAALQRLADGTASQCRPWLGLDTLKYASKHAPPAFESWILGQRALQNPRTPTFERSNDRGPIRSGVRGLETPAGFNNHVGVTHIRQALGKTLQRQVFALEFNAVVHQQRKQCAHAPDGLPCRVDGVVLVCRRRKRVQNGLAILRKKASGNLPGGVSWHVATQGAMVGL